MIACDNITLQISDDSNDLDNMSLGILIKPLGAVSMAYALVTIITENVLDALVEYIFARTKIPVPVNVINDIKTSPWLLLDDGRFITDADYEDYCRRHGSLEIGTSYILTVNGFLPLSADI